ncbi:BatD family protein [Ruegeria sp. HKCCA4008]|uniref:BatD family protein n=1 Tax=Ruegeria sp. HKCCA4008 TaxID=2682999 RepID=UPI0014886B59|nr:BatD family protein [Ruegeria sp. HKCCA4008]
MRYLAVFILFLPLSVSAQENSAHQPRVSVDVPNEAVIVGQPAIVRIKVLVPTFMPQPPVFPSLEQQNVLVRLPERASGPISETVDGETWSGVQRSYRLYPLASGPVAYDAQEVVVTFADPQSNDPVQVSVALPSIQLNAEIPEGAQGLDPLIIASGFSLDQKLDGPTDMQAGDSITREISAQISGTTALTIPALTPQDQSQLLHAYPKEPRFSETEDRGILSGQRVEETVYIAQDGGETQLSAVSIDWFNLDTGQIETASLPPTKLTLAPPRRQPPDAQTIIKSVLYLVIVVFALWTLGRFLCPRYATWKTERRRRYLASEKYAVDALRSALISRDLPAVYQALDLWKSRSAHPERSLDLEKSLMNIGAARYSATAGNGSEDWDAAMLNLGALKSPTERKSGSLPPLNP